MAVAPNLTALVGELVGARLIAHAGIYRYNLNEKYKNNLKRNQIFDIIFCFCI